MNAMNDTVGPAFSGGDLDGALQGATAAVRARPRDSGLRWRLAEMLLFTGAVERADKALDAVIENEPSPAVLEFRRLLRAEQDRVQVFRQQGVPKFQGDDPTPAQKAVFRALVLSREGDTAGAAAASEEAETLRPHVAGSIDGVAFDDFRDADDLFGPHIEVLTAAGDYMWVPIERLERLELGMARRPRDLYWRRTDLTLRDGTEGLVFLPLIYPTGPEAPASIRLGRETTWPDDATAPVRGAGLRLMLAGDDAVALGSARTILFG